MIAGSVRMGGFDSPSFARLCAIAARRDLNRGRELHVLHDGGRVLSVVDTADGPVRNEWAPIGDAHATAKRLRAEHGVDRVVVADASTLRAAYAAVEATVDPTWSQPGVMLALQQAFRDCPGVVCDPPLGALDAWRAVEQTLIEAGDGGFVIAASDAEDWPIALTGRLRGGLIVEVTDLAPDDVRRLPALPAGTVASIVTRLDVLEDALTSAAVGAALASLLERVT
jgi:hypothetical protein